MAKEPAVRLVYDFKSLEGAALTTGDQYKAIFCFTIGDALRR